MIYSYKILQLNKEDKGNRGKLFISYVRLLEKYERIDINNYKLIYAGNVKSKTKENAHILQKIT